MRRLIPFVLLINCIWAYAQEKDDKVLFDVYVHYQSTNKGPKIYLYDGDVLRLELIPNIGKVGLTMIRQTELGEFREEKLPLVTDQDTSWTFDYQVIRDGLYTIQFEKDEKLGYIDTRLKVSRIPVSGNAAKPTSFLADNEAIRPGSERFLTRAEVRELKKSPLNLKIEKEVSSAGVAYCETTFNLRRNQKAVINLVADDDDRRTHFVIQRKVGNATTTLIDEYQYGIEDFGFISLSGGEYLIRYWGIGVFRRVDDLTIEIGY